MVLTTIGLVPAPARAESSEAPEPGWPAHVASAIPEVLRPPAAVRQRCAFDTPVCVHTQGRVPRARVDEALATARHTLRALQAAGLPSPLPDGFAGGGPELDLYLDAAATAPTAQADTEVTTIGFDRAPTYVVIPPEVAGPPCAFGAAVARATAEAVLLGFDAAQHASTLASFGSYVASRLRPCHAVELAAMDRFQRQPYRALTEAERDQFTGSYVLPWWLDERWGTGLLGGVMAGLVATSSQTSPTADRWLTNEPDVWDALRKVLGARESSLGDLLVDLAIARAFVGDRSDGMHLPDTEWMGALGRVRFEWAVDYDSLPRRLAPAAAVEPTGATYVYLDLAKADPHARLLVLAEWETAYVFEWAAVRLDAQGRELSRRLAGGVYGQDRVELRIDDIDGAQSLLLVGTALGHDDRKLDFDPDRGPPHRQSYTLTIHPE
ncbi:MAG: hypothetical protein R3B72_26140 [Polyangiaceae bacterium]